MTTGTLSRVDDIRLFLYRRPTPTSAQEAEFLRSYGNTSQTVSSGDDLMALFSNASDEIARTTAIKNASAFRQWMSGFFDLSIGSDQYDVEQLLLERKSSVVITYPEQNAVGTLKCTIRPGGINPVCGDIIFLDYNDGSGILFRGTIVRVSNSAHTIEIIAENTLGMLRCQNILAFSKLSGITALYNIAKSSGIVLYHSPGTESRLSTTKQYTAYYTNRTNLDAIRDLIERISVEEGIYLVLSDMCGVIKITDTQDLITNYVLAPETMTSWKITQSIERDTYNRLMFTVSPQVSESTDASGQIKSKLFMGGTGTSSKGVVMVDANTKASWGINSYTGDQHLVSVNPYLSMMYGRFLTLARPANTVQEGLALQKAYQSNMAMPKYSITCKEVTGIPCLRPGYSINLDLGVFGTGNKQIITETRKAVRAVIKSVTHTWSVKGYLMDIECTCDPNQDPGHTMPKWSTENPLGGLTGPVYTWSNQFMLRSAELSSKTDNKLMDQASIPAQAAPAPLPVPEILPE